MKRIIAILFLCLAMAVGCTSKTETSQKPETSPKSITLATTTSTRDSGLLDALLPVFEQQSGIEVKVVAVGSGQAIAMGRRGDADLLLTHSPAAELEFLADGFTDERRGVMHNDFVIVGPSQDTAGIDGQATAAEALAAIANSGATFVSRGDDSGTHAKEKTIWRETHIEPQGEWYLEAGSGMAQTLRLASEKQGYALTDRSTFLANREQLELVVLSEGDPLLLNFYAVMLVSREKHPHVAFEEAQQFADFLLSTKAQSIIAKFGIEQYGQPLFFQNRPGQAEE